MVEAKYSGLRLQGLKLREDVLGAFVANLRTAWVVLVLISLTIEMVCLVKRMLRAIGGEKMTLLLHDVGEQCGSNDREPEVERGRRTSVSFLRVASKCRRSDVQKKH